MSRFIKTKMVLTDMGLSQEEREKNDTLGIANPEEEDHWVDCVVDLDSIQLARPDLPPDGKYLPEYQKLGRGANSCHVTFKYGSDCYLAIPLSEMQDLLAEGCFGGIPTYDHSEPNITENAHELVS